jgi:CBS domain-containing protein
VASSHSSSESVITGTVVSFLKNVPPFQFLSVPELARLSRHMTLEFFPKDTVILSAGHPASESLYIVHKGGVKLALRSQVGKQLVLDMRSEGEIFGLLSVMSKDLARLDVTAIEDTLCYRVPAEHYSLDVQDAHHALSDAFLTARVWQKMLYMLRGKRVRTLRKLLSLGGV